VGFYRRGAHDCLLNGLIWFAVYFPMVFRKSKTADGQCGTFPKFQTCRIASLRENTTHAANPKKPVRSALATTGKLLSIGRLLENNRA